ncbi:MAG TPA: LD-carboxypeptidase [Mycobacteriales bacterium]|nr:LD-carboxypeptidase [Mycobacteriales bacterium]
MALRPPALRAGDGVALISPAGPVDADAVQRGADRLAAWGFRPVVGAHALERTHYLAGSDAGRCADFAAAIEDPSIRAIVCTRGGYGSQRIVDDVPFEMLRDDPKLLIGFSDITALHLALWRRAGLASLHGPGGTFDFAPGAAEVLNSCLTDPDYVVTVAADPAEDGYDVRVPGVASGPLLGGNLSLLAASVGTVDLVPLQGAVLLLEEVGEQPYRIDRMLTQLLRSGAFRGVAGIAIGQLTECDGRWTAAEVFADRLGDLGVPIVGGLPVGHGQGVRIVPLGTTCVLDAGAGTLRAKSPVS